MSPLKNTLFKIGLVCTALSLVLGIGLFGYLIVATNDESKRTSRLVGNGSSQQATIDYRNADIIAVGYLGPATTVTVTDPAGKPVPVSVPSDSTLSVDGKDSRVLGTFVAETPGVYRVTVSLDPSTTPVHVRPDKGGSYVLGLGGSGTMCCLLFPLGLLSMLFGARQAKKEAAPPFSQPF